MGKQRKMKTARTEKNMQWQNTQGMQQGTALNQQSAREASASTTHRDRGTGARGDSTHQRYNSGIRKDDIKRAQGGKTRHDEEIR
ncbi:hypothetical protein GJ700_20230 [Duganella sp. FT92W]|uniref:Uncharacterized protein n=1 Tax=Pseudoduganella rivuli TaxID=2666085 RepID=A0A7X2LSZ3_9BURK|nr:hypothetical protein [Pseudoduganella rivuli]MRV74040.1 hypothetical protein [Pseudoduganella rivuli]